MIRPFTCVCLLLAAGAGLYTYQAKHQAELLDRQIAQVLKLADTARQRSSVLRAEYALLNDPQRLSQLAGAHLPNLRSTEPGQFTTLAELDRRLPPIGAPSVPAPPVTEPTETSPLFLPMIGVPLANLPPPVSAPPATTVSLPVAVPAAPPPPVTAQVVAPDATPIAIKEVATKDVVAKDAVAKGVVPPTVTTKPQTTRLAQASSPTHRAKPAPQRVAAARAPRSDSFVTPVAAPSEALARLAQNSLGVGRSGVGGTGGATFSSLGMARTGIVSYPAATPTR